MGSLFKYTTITMNNKNEKFNKWTKENNKYWLDDIKGKEYNEIYIP